MDYAARGSVVQGVVLRTPAAPATVGMKLVPSRKE